LAKDEVLKTAVRLATETQAAAQAQETAEAELMAERLARRNAEVALAKALEARQEAEQRSRDAITVREARMPSQAPAKLRVATSHYPHDKATVLAQVDSESKLHSLVAVGDPPTPATGNPRLSNGGNRTGRSDYARRAGLPRSDDHIMLNLPGL
jgi:hypothetical protein